jgi:hypothetical protein
MHTATDTTFRQGTSLGAQARAYFLSDGARTIQTILGLVWLLDGALQFQSFMYSKRFIQTLTAMEPGQPHWLASTIAWGARLANADLGLWNTLFALTQVLIGLGLLYRPLVRAALAGSFVWVLVVWWFGEAFGMLLANQASPLTGAPGGVLLYGLIGLLVWPNGRPGGLLGPLGARIMWAAVWIVMGYLWLLPVNTTANSTHDTIAGAASGMHWFDTLAGHIAPITAGNGLFIAIVLAAVSIAIGVAVGIDRQARTFLWLAIYLNILYWLFGQSLGGLATGSATDPNAAPLFAIFAAALFTLLPSKSPEPAASRQPRDLALGNG